MVRVIRSLASRSTGMRETSSALDLNRRALGSIAAPMAAPLLVCEPTSAQNRPELRLCPPTVVDTCYIGYVASAGKIVVLLSSRGSCNRLRTATRRNEGSIYGQREPVSNAKEGDSR